MHLPPQLTSLPQKGKQPELILNYMQTGGSFLYRQQSRVYWLQLGDRNTKFFHRSLIHRQCRNMIHVLADESGTRFKANWLLDSTRPYYQPPFSSKRRYFKTLPLCYPPTSIPGLELIANHRWRDQDSSCYELCCVFRKKGCTIKNSKNTNYTKCLIKYFSYYFINYMFLNI
jgi:hypothetical protein